MGNKQYDIEFEEKPDVQSYYVDQAIHHSTYGYRSITSAYTPWGISKIDEQYCTLIRNMHFKVKQLYAINRRVSTYCDIKTRQEHEVYLGYHTYYDPIELNDRYCEVRVEWENGHIHDFFYGNKPVFDINTRKTNPEQLRKEIIDNPHLHVKIKENLVGNLDSYLKMDLEF